MSVPTYTLRPAPPVVLRVAGERWMESRWELHIDGVPVVGCLRRLPGGTDGAIGHAMAVLDKELVARMTVEVT